MSILDWFFRDPKGFKTHVIYVPEKMNHALEAFAYINEVDTEEVILQSLQEYLTSNLWAAKEHDRRTKIKRAKQLRD
jgi:hypothetical protein